MVKLAHVDTALVLLWENMDTHQETSISYLSSVKPQDNQSIQISDSMY